MSSIKREGGTYALVIFLKTGLHHQIGSLGICDLPDGYYIYVGSALGGLDSRLKHHLRAEKRLRWHIDYLLKSARIVEIWYTYSGQRLECIWNRVIGQLPGAMHPVLKFGASDCHCLTHLTHLTSPPLLPIFRDMLKETSCPSEVFRLV
jgi:sugar fermentation stimulation protein A